jgi:hypothetical protein
MSDRTPQPWAENERPTAKQLADWLTACSADEREVVVGRLIESSEIASTCLLQNHAADHEYARTAYDAGFAAALEQMRAGLEAGLPQALGLSEAP